MGAEIMRVSMAFAFGLVAIQAVACGNGTGDVPSTSGSGPLADAGSAVNPEGVTYPAPLSGYGRTPRSGTTPGSVIQNFKFTGRRPGASDMVTVSLADYYDPCNKRAKILHLSVAAVWCEPCRQETIAVVADLSSPNSLLVADRVTFVQALDEGATQGTPATPSDLNYWIQNHNSNFTELLDPGLANLGGFFNAAAVPWNADIDVRTMEILDSSEGWAGDLPSELATGLAALPSAPSYAIPESAHCAN